MMPNSEARKRAAATCRECGPGYRVGDDGCRHAAANEPSVDVEALAEVLMASVLVPGPLRYNSHEGLVLTHSEATRPARAILASDWLAAHTAAAEARGAERVRSLVNEFSAEIGPTYDTAKQACDALSVLLRLAAQIGRDS